MNIEIKELLSDKDMNKDKLIKIKKVLDYCCNIYYNTSNNSPLTDEEFDKLVKVFDEHSTKSYSTLTAPPSGKRLIDVSHDFPELVGTVEKANTIDEVKEWLYARVDSKEIFSVDASFKEDGNSVTLTFDKNGKNELALTRGKEGKGVDLTRYFKHIRAILPNKKSQFGLKCEAVMSDTDFKEYNEIYYSLNGKHLANSRSAVAGILGSDDGIKYSRFIKLVPLAIKFKDIDINREEEIRLINVIGTQPDFLPLEYKILRGNREQVLHRIEEWYKKVIDEHRDNHGRPIDGIVISLMDSEKRASLGREDDKNKFDIALKFPYLVKKSKVKDIKFYLGKTNRVTPVVLFDDVVFNGATCNHVSISNYARYKELKLKKGDNIIIEYRNDVLSYLSDNLDSDKEGKLIPFVNTCPSCGSKLSINKNMTFVFCKNDECPNLITGKCVNYLTKLGIKGIKESTIDRIVNAGLISKLEDVYSLDRKELLKIDGFKEKTVDNILKAINSRTEIIDWELIGSLNIDGFGRKSAKLLCKEYTIKELYTYIKDKSFKSRVTTMDGFSDISANKIEHGLVTNFNTIKAIMKKVKVTSSKIDKETLKNIKLYKIVFTGFRDKDIQAKLEQLGHSVTSSVSKNTDMVVTKDVNGSSSKLKSARELGKKIITPDELKKIFNI